MALYLLYGIVSITRRFKLNELLVLLHFTLPTLTSHDVNVYESRENYPHTGVSALGKKPHLNKPDGAIY